MTATLYCGNNSYGYRHIINDHNQNHVADFDYAGANAWTLFSEAIAATLKTPQPLSPTYQEGNDTYLYNGPWTNLNYGEDIQITYLFFVIINTVGTIISAYARERSSSAIPGMLGAAPEGSVGTTQSDGVRLASTGSSFECLQVLG